MNTILAHLSQERIYLPILQKIGDSKKVIATNLHESIFDVYHKIKPDMVIVPIHEYTQEFHDFVVSFKDKIDIVLYTGNVFHDEIIKYYLSNKIKIIGSNQLPEADNVLRYSYIYDDQIYKNLDQERNDKILVILSNDNDKNHSLLDDILYPKTKIKLCLTNNHTFKHPQNIGVTNTNDLSVVLNSFGSLIDIDSNFTIEAQACNINNILVSDNLINNIQNKTYIDHISNIEEYTITNFVNNKILKFLGA